MWNFNPKTNSNQLDTISEQNLERPYLNHPQQQHNIDRQIHDMDCTEYWKASSTKGTKEVSQMLGLTVNYCKFMQVYSDLIRLCAQLTQHPIIYVSGFYQDSQVNWTVLTEGFLPYTYQLRNCPFIWQMYPLLL